jgi:hypothetical protein
MSVTGPSGHDANSNGRLQGPLLARRDRIFGLASTPENQKSAYPFSPKPSTQPFDFRAVRGSL